MESIGSSGNQSGGKEEGKGAEQGHVFKKSGTKMHLCTPLIITESKCLIQFLCHKHFYLISAIIILLFDTMEMPFRLVSNQLDGFNA